MLNPTQHTRMRWSDGCAKLLLQIDKAYLNKLAARMAGPRPAARRCVRRERGAGCPAAQGWLARFLGAVVNASAGVDYYSAESPHQAMREEVLVAAFLAAQPSNVQHLMQPAVHGPTARQIRRAIDYIHANVAQPMTMSDVAEAAGARCGACSWAFVSTWGCRPSTI